MNKPLHIATRVVVWIAGAMLAIGLLLVGGLYLITPKSESPETAMRKIEQRISSPDFDADLAAKRKALMDDPIPNVLGHTVICENGDWLVYDSFTIYTPEHRFRLIMARDNSGLWYKGFSAQALVNGLEGVGIPKSIEHVLELDTTLTPFEPENDPD